MSCIGINDKRRAKPQVLQGELSLEAKNVYIYIYILLTKYIKGTLPSND